MNCRVTILIAIMVSCVFIKAQDLSQIKGNKKPLTISGGISTNHALFAANTPNSTRTPYNYSVNGSLNVSLYGWSVPLSFSYSNQQVGFRQPFNQYGLSPKYKWVTAHLGYRSMSFSPYTLGGHLFLGAGVELTPGDKWEISTMYGRLQKEVEFNGSNQPFYRRMGTALKVTRKHDKGKISVIAFRGWDDENSLLTPPDSLVNPEENMVVSLALDQQLTEKLSFSLEAARSAYTRDKRSDVVSVFSGSSFDALIPIAHKASTKYYGAIKGDLNYAFTWAILGLGYERIGPDYKTLGAYYFNNDFQNTTLNISTSLFKKKVSISSNVGLQRNNLDDQKASQTKRFVGSVNVSGNLGEKISLSGSYSNFQTFTTIIPIDQQVQQLTPEINFDSLDFVQLSQSSSINGSYRISANKKRVNSMSASITRQKVTSKQGDGPLVDGTKVYSSNLSYSFTYIPAKLSLNLGLNGSLSNSGLNQNKLYGTNLGASKPFFKDKLSVNTSINLNRSIQNNTSNGLVLNSSIGLGTSIRKQHNVSLNTSYVNTGQVGNKISQVTMSFSYNYSFSLLDKKNKTSEDKTSK